MRKAWSSAAVIAVNTLLLFVVANVVAVFFVPNDETGAGPVEYANAWLIDSYGFDVLKRGYPGWNDDDLRVFLAETSNWPQVFEPYTMFKPRPRADRFIGIDAAGFRPSPGQRGRDVAAWRDLWQRRAPADDTARDIFVFGGSTTMGAGVPDGATIPAQLKVLADAACLQPVRVFNFGRGFYFSTQERVLFEKLLLDGARPEISIFIDGLNDFYFAVDEPRYSDRFAALIEEANKSIVPVTKEAATVGDAVAAAIEALPLVRLWRRHVPPAIADASAADFAPPWGRQTEAQAVVERLSVNREMIRAVAGRFGVRPLFVLQPVPTYGYDLDHMNVAQAGKLAFGRHELSGVGYPLLAVRHAAGATEADMLWLGDLQRDWAENLYVDAVHYTEVFSRTIVGAIFERLVAGGLLDCSGGAAR